MTDQQDPHDAAPVFPTAEGGAVPAEIFFAGIQWHYLIVMDLTQVPQILREPLHFYLVRAAYEFLGEGKFSVWENTGSSAIACHTIPEKFELFKQRVKEAVEIFATHHIVKINYYTMSLQRSS